MSFTMILWKRFLADSHVLEYAATHKPKRFRVDQYLEIHWLDVGGTPVGPVGSNRERKGRRLTSEDAVGNVDPEPLAAHLVVAPLGRDVVEDEAVLVARVQPTRPTTANPHTHK